MFQKIGEAVARGIMNFSDVEKSAQGIPVHPRCQSKSCWSKPVGNNCLWIKGLTVTSHVCPKYTRISRVPAPLQDAGPTGRPGSVAVSRPWRDGGAEERPGRAGTRRAGAEQGRPVPGTHPNGWVQAPGVAERSRGDGRQTYDTHD